MGELEYTHDGQGKTRHRNGIKYLHDTSAVVYMTPALVSCTFLQSRVLLALAIVRREF